MRNLVVILFIGLNYFMWPALADVRLAPVFSSNMLLQRDTPITLLGWADEGEQISISLGDQIVGTTIGQGKVKSWSIVLPQFQAGPISDLTIKGKNTLVLSHLMAGDVWVCSGQSNMEMTLAKGPWCEYGGALDSEREVAASHHSRLRLFNARDSLGWTICQPDTAQRFSAVAYFFGRDLSKETGVPVGLVLSAVGGTAAEYWLPRSVRETWAGFPEALKAARSILEELGPSDSAYRAALAEWQKVSKQAKKDGQRVPPQPVSTLSPAQQELMATARIVEKTGFYYEKRIEPLTLMPIKGVIWYQGEGNVTRHSEYAELMTQLVNSWRKAWNQKDLPFLIVQLVNYGSRAPSGEHLWAKLRVAQQTVVDSVPNTALTVGIDLGESKNIHPANKQDVGRRLALLALGKVYGHKNTYEGPKPLNTRFETGKVIVEFDQNVVLKTDGETGFELASKIGIFHPASAEATGKSITLTSSAVLDPDEVRYAWRDNPVATISNAEGLPSAPFHKHK